MSIYEELQPVVNELLGDPEFKQGIIRYVKNTPGNGPRDDPGPPTLTFYNLNAAARGVSQKYVDNSQIVASDLQVTMGVVEGVTPDVTGFVEVDGKSYKIIAVKAIPPAGVPVAYALVFRK